MDVSSPDAGSTQSRHRHVRGSSIRSQWGGGWWPRSRRVVGIASVPAALIALLAAAGCGGGSAASQIRIPPAKGRPTLPPPDAVVMAQEDGTLGVALGARPAAGGIELMATIVGPDNQGKEGLDVEFTKGGV